MKKILLTLALSALSSLSFAHEILKIGASPVPHAEILEAVQPILKQKGIEIKVLEFQDYVQPNLALNDKDLDANFFQHLPYLENFSKERNLKLVSVGVVHVEPMGIYSRKVKNLNNLHNSAKIGIPNDPTNGGRALLILSKAGLIKLRSDSNIKATLNDIVENPLKIRIIELEAATLPRALDDLDAAVINSNYALGANLNPVKDALVIEGKDSPYANVIAVRAGDEKRPEIKELISSLQTEQIRKFIKEKYKGAVVPAF